MGEYTKDIIFAIIFFIYPFFLMLISKHLTGMGVRQDTARKFVHCGMGLVILFIPFFTHLWIALLPPFVFIAINMIDYKCGIFAQIQGEDKGNIGTVLYPISFFLLIWSALVEID